MKYMLLVHHDQEAHARRSEGERQVSFRSLFSSQINFTRMVSTSARRHSTLHQRRPAFEFVTANGS